MRDTRDVKILKVQRHINYSFCQQTNMSYDSRRYRVCKIRVLKFNQR